MMIFAIDFTAEGWACLKENNAYKIEKLIEKAKIELWSTACRQNQNLTDFPSKKKAFDYGELNTCALLEGIATEIYFKKACKAFKKRNLREFTRNKIKATKHAETLKSRFKFGQAYESAGGYWWAPFVWVEERIHYLNQMEEILKTGKVKPFIAKDEIIKAVEKIKNIKAAKNKKHFTVRPSIVKLKQEGLFVKKWDGEKYLPEEKWFIKGIVYVVRKIGDDPSKGPCPDWFEFSPPVSRKCLLKAPHGNLATCDGALLKAAGINTLRFYHPPEGKEAIEKFKKEMRFLYFNYGIMAAMGHFFGAYGVGVGEKVDYSEERIRKKIEASFIKMIKNFKDEPWLLLWIVGNENEGEWTYTNAKTNPKAYYSFVAEVVKKAKKLDPNHPLAICTLQTVNVEKSWKYLKGVIDLFGTNAYRSVCFTDLWETVKEYYGDTPILITEFGCDAFNNFEGLRPAENGNPPFESLNYQVWVVSEAWKDILRHKNRCVGGFIFEWMDEWWKDPAGSPFLHDRGPGTPFMPDKSAQEEWFGIMAQQKEDSPYIRIPRETFWWLVLRR